MNDIEIQILRKEVKQLRKELDYLYRFLGNFVDNTGETIEKVQSDIIIKYNPLKPNTGKEEND